MSAYSNSEDAVAQIRVSLQLAAEVTDRSLEVPTGPIAVPASVGRRGLAAVINHLLGRKDVLDDKESDNNAQDSDDNGDYIAKLPAIPFEFVLKENNRLLRSGVEREARRYGLSLEKPLAITYFPAQGTPELKGESETLPDWISCLSYAQSHVGSNENDGAFLVAAAYDGSLRIYRPTNEHIGENKKLSSESDSVTLNPIAETRSAHEGPVKCLSAMIDPYDQNLMIATGSMDHTLVIHSLDSKSRTLQKQVHCQQAHTSAICSLDFFSASRMLASGDWDGTLAVWNLNAATVLTVEGEQARKKAKTGIKAQTSGGSSTGALKLLTPTTVLPKAHSQQISGISWGNVHKPKYNSKVNDGQQQLYKTLITGSWDHSLKVWDTERQECVLSLNGSRVVACLDTSHHSDGIVATGHPDTVRLWDVRTSSGPDSNNNANSSFVSDKTFRPSHKAWVSGVQWSPNNPYHLASTSHDGTVTVSYTHLTLPTNREV